MKTARVEAIGTLRKAKVAYYNNRNTKKYEEHLYNENMEVTSMLGDITMMERKPFLHLHANLGRKDMSGGGHLVSAEVHPFLEVVFTPASNLASRRYDETLNLNAIYDIR